MSEHMPPLFELSLSEKLEIVEALWDNIAAKPDELPVPAWQVEELARRKAAALRDPNAGSSWEEVKERILRRHD